MKLEKFALWLILWAMFVAIAFCADATGIARYGGKVIPYAEWLKILAGGTMMWAIAFWAFSQLQPARNRYFLRTRIRRWWERQFPLLPPG